MIQRDLTWGECLNPELGILWATLEDGTREWKENLEEPSEAAIRWSPFANGPSIGGLILHVAAAEQWWIQKIAADAEIDPTDPAWAYDCEMDQYGPHWPTPPSEPISWYFEVLANSRRRMFELVLQHNNPASHHEGSRSAMTYRWIIAHLVEHDSYHGGQAVLLHEMYKKLVR